MKFRYLSHGVHGAALTMFTFPGISSSNTVLPDFNKTCLSCSLFFVFQFTASVLTQCQKEYQKILRSWILPGPYIPQCTHEGKYEPMQCQGLYCYCVNEHGVELVGTRMDITEGKPKCRAGGNYFAPEFRGLSIAIWEKKLIRVLSQISHRKWGRFYYIDSIYKTRLGAC